MSALVSEVGLGVNSRRLVEVIVFEGKPYYGLEYTHVRTRLEKAPEALSVLVPIVETGRAQTTFQMGTA